VSRQHHVSLTSCLLDVMSPRRHVSSTSCLLDVMSPRRHVSSTSCLLLVVCGGFGLLWVWSLQHTPAVLAPLCLPVCRMRPREGVRVCVCACVFVRECVYECVCTRTRAQMDIDRENVRTRQRVDGGRAARAHSGSFASRRTLAPEDVHPSLMFAPR